MQPSTREMQVRNISLQDIQNNQQQIQNHQIQQGSSFDHQTHDDFLDQMLSNLPASWSELKSPWDLHPQNPNVNTSSATHNNNNSDNHHHKVFNIPIGGGNKSIDLSENPSGSQQDNHLHHYPCDESTVLASRLRQHQISGNSPKSMILQQQLLISGAAGGGLARSPTSTSVIGGDSVLFPLPLTLGSGESSDDVPFKSSNPNGEGSVPGLFNGITGTLPRPNQSGNQQHFLHPQAGSMSAPNFGSQSTGLNQVPAGPSAGGGGGTAPTRQKVRARRGQATDPHSIAERLRRERIAERMKALQELVPNANKTDKASMLDEIIDYVKFLQLQVKVLSMSRLGGAAALAPLVADISSEGGGGDGVQGGIGRNSNGNQNETTNDSLTVTEHQVAKLMEEDMGSAMQYLQGKGLCLMPISLATAISTATSHSRNPTNNNIMTNPLLGSNLDGSSSPNLSVLTAQSAAMASGVGGGSGGGGETSVKD